jgi:hypothetical protein
MSDEYECGRMEGKKPTYKRWIDCVRQDMREMAVSDEMTSDRGEWREKTCCATPNELGKGQEEENNL